MHSMVRIVPRTIGVTLMQKFSFCTHCGGYYTQLVLAHGRAMPFFRFKDAQTVTNL